MSERQYPPFNHSRGDGLYAPCSICKEIAKANGIQLPEEPALDFKTLSLHAQACFILIKLGLDMTVDSGKELLDPTVDEDAIIIDSRVYVVKSNDGSYVAQLIREHPGSREEPPSEEYIELANSCTDKADLTLLNAIECAVRLRVEGVLEGFDRDDTPTV